MPGRVAIVATDSCYKKIHGQFFLLEAKYGTPGPGVIKQVLEKEKDTE